jgi:sec-independent protein translocase protein TatB
MFDIGFWELSIIALVGLIVIGPERLPGVARTVGKWVGRTRRFVHQVKSDIDSEIKQDEIRKALENETGLNDIKQELDTDRYSFEEEKDYLVDAVSDEKENTPSASTEQKEPEEYIDADTELTKSNEQK